MPFQFDGDGYISWTGTYGTSGEFTISGTFTYTNNGTEDILPFVNGTFLQIQAGGQIQAQNLWGNTITLSGFSDGEEVVYEWKRDGADLITLTCNAESGTATASGFIQFKDFTSSSSTYTGIMSGLCNISLPSASPSSYSFDFDQPVGTSDLPELDNGSDGTLTSFTTGDYLATGTIVPSIMNQLRNQGI